MAFDKLNSELARRRAEVDLFVVGGAAIILTYDTDRRTRDGNHSGTLMLRRLSLITAYV